MQRELPETSTIMFKKRNERASAITDFLNYFEVLNDEWEEICGCVLAVDKEQTKKNKDKFRKKIEESLKSGETVQGIEALYNHKHMSMALLPFGVECTPELLGKAAKIYLAVTESKLRKTFPDKHFIFDIYQEDDGEMTVIFYQGESDNV